MNNPATPKLHPRTPLAHALYSLIEEAHQPGVSDEIRVQVDEVRAVIEGDPQADSLRTSISADLDELAATPLLTSAVKDVRDLLPGGRATWSRSGERPLGRLIAGRVDETGYWQFSCGCGSNEFAFEDESRGELREYFGLRRRSGPAETMWRFSKACLKGGLQEARVYCTACGRLFAAEAGVAPNRPVARSEGP